MKKMILLLAIYPLLGCESLGRHFQQLSECNREVDSKIPPRYVRIYIRTDTSCNSSGIATPTTIRGDQYISSGTTNCTSTPIYETIEENGAERNALRNQCMSAKKASYEQQSNFQEELIKRPIYSPKFSSKVEDKNIELRDKVIAEKISQGYQTRKSTDGRIFIVKNDVIYGWVLESGSYQKIRD